jgi:hypothetical protein
MNKLKYRLIKLEKALVFQVLEQDERFRCPSSGSTSPAFNASNGVRVRSNDTPTLVASESTITEIYLRGHSRSNDYFPAQLRFSDNNSRDNAAVMIARALQEWAAGFAGFITLPPPATESYDTYTV